LAAIGELAGMIGHDLRNPLTGIKNSAYYLKKKGQDLPQEQKEMLDTIDKCVDYSNRIINDLLDYSREIHLIVEKHSPKKILDDSLTLVNLPPQVAVKNELNESTQLMVDSDKIKRVFINLIKNAVEAMPEGGEITINAKENKDTIEIGFTDTGVGINEEILPKLFAPLFTTKAQGMGFGLAICKRIIEAHKGTIVVKSVKGQGTTFTLTLPVNLKIEFGGEKEWINNPAYS
jgi:signal transduction histidine kinase